MQTSLGTVGGRVVETEANRYSLAACPHLDTTGPVARSFDPDGKRPVARTQTTGDKVRSMKGQRILGVCVLLAFAGYLVAAPEIEASRIQSILETPQTYDGEIRERLVALGSPAVPAIGQALSTGYAFPV